MARKRRRTPLGILLLVAAALLWLVGVHTITPKLPGDIPKRSPEAPKPASAERIRAASLCASERAREVRDRVGLVSRAVQQVFFGKNERPPGESCRISPHPSSVEVDFEEISSRIATPKSERVGCIVYLAQKRHSSYMRDSFGMLEKSLDLLYKNYNYEFKQDVLVFHTGELGESDSILLNKNGKRPEITLIELPIGSKYWELPGIVDRGKANQWKDKDFSEGYRHMCRWYAGLLFEFVSELGYTYVMRVDEDSYLLSKISYNLFDFMQKNGYEYAYRNDALEPCCDDKFRQMYIKAFRQHDNSYLRKRGFADSCCFDEDGNYLNRGFYNNFFISKVSFWLQPDVRRFFNFVDWTGGIYLYRENDLIIQSLSVQMYMPKEKVHKFEEWSYEHVSGANCDWGVVVRGKEDFSPSPVDDIIEHYHHKNRRSKAIPAKPGSGVAWEALYCASENKEADFEESSLTATFCADLMRISPQARDSLKDTTGFDFMNGKEFDTKNAVKEAEKAQRMLEKIRSCKRGDGNPIAIFVEEPECGAGCSLNYMVEPMMHAVNQRVALLTPMTKWAEPSLCDLANSLACFLKSFAKRDDSDPRCAKRSNPSRIDMTTGTWWRIKFDDGGQFSGPHRLPRVLNPFEEKGTFWNVAQVLKNLLQPNDALDAKLRETLFSLNLERPALGIHVRLGDSCNDPAMATKGRRCDGLESFIPSVELLMQKFQFRSIYLATDSEDVIRNATTTYSHLPWQFNRKIERKKYDVFTRAKMSDELTIEGILFGDKRLKDAGFSKYDEMMDFLIDVLVLGMHTDGFVGKFTSNMDRIVAALSLATGNKAGTCVKPMVSLDASWCFDFNVQSGIGLDGKRFYC